MKIRKACSLMSFNNYLQRVGQPAAMPTYVIHNPIGANFLTRLSLGLSHLNEHKFNHDCKSFMFMQFGDWIPSHFFLHFHYFTDIRSTLLDDLKLIDLNIPSFPDSEILALLLYGSPKFDHNQNTKILSSSISFILKFERINGSLL